MVYHWSYREILRNAETITAVKRLVVGCYYREFQ